MKIDKKYKWLARDKDGQLCAFVSEPSKNKVKSHWNNTSGFGWSKIKEEDERFSFVKWEDEHGVKISDIVDYFDSDENDVISKPSHYIVTQRNRQAFCRSTHTT